jgi:hypothetical protein
MKNCFFLENNASTVELLKILQNFGTTKEVYYTRVSLTGAPDIRRRDPTDNEYDRFSLYPAIFAE